MSATPQPNGHCPNPSDPQDSAGPTANGPRHRPAARWPAWPLALSVAALLSACATVRPGTAVDVAAPPQWQTPVPNGQPDTHPGASGQAAALKGWWRQWQDPVLLDLQDSARRASPTVAAAATRVAQARLAVVVAGSATSPSVGATAGVARTVALPQAAPLTQGSLGVQASWELDLWGGLRAGAVAADERLQAAGAQWHAARVAVAAEVASRYTAWRSCQQVLAITEVDGLARATVARLTEDRARAGFDAPAQAALAQASAAQARMNAAQQRAGCDTTLKGLVALTDLDEATLRQRLRVAENKEAENPTNKSAEADFRSKFQPLPELAPSALPVVLPAQLLAQRPDVWAAQRAVVAASADVGVAEADRYPRLTLAGYISGNRSPSAAGDGSTWSLGPLQLSLPLFDAGRREGQVRVQRAAHDEAVVAYRATVRTAVSEVEQALVALHSTAARQRDAAVATRGFVQALQAATDRHRAGLGSLLELEDTRRSALAAELALAELGRDRLLAWVDLYRALGGGWRATDALPEGGAETDTNHNNANANANVNSHPAAANGAAAARAPHPKEPT